MIAKTLILRVGVVILCAFMTMGCRDMDTLTAARPSSEPVVFDDDFSQAGFRHKVAFFQPFMGSYEEAMSVDHSVSYAGLASMRITVPPAKWSGGAVTTNLGRDFSSYNALTFWAKASIPSTLDIVGFGNDNTGNSLYTAGVGAIPLSTQWKKVTIPIPRPSALAAEGGLMFFAESAENVNGHTLWFDEVKFERVNNISNPRPQMETKIFDAFSGARIEIPDGQVIFRVGRDDLVVGHLPSYFTFDSTDPGVAYVEDGFVIAKGAGTTTITAKLDSIDVAGTMTVNVTAPPSTPAPTPTHPADDIISIFSNAYPNVDVSTWSADWDKADVSDLTIGGNDTKAYTNLSFAGIELSQTIDISEMTTLHMDVWIATGSNLKIKLVDFGEDGVYSGAPDNEHELTITADTVPALSFGQWASLEIPMEDFLYLITKEHLAQIILAGDGKTVYIDNLYFHR